MGSGDFLKTLDSFTGKKGFLPSRVGLFKEDGQLIAHDSSIDLFGFALMLSLFRLGSQMKNIPVQFHRFAVGDFLRRERRQGNELALRPLRIMVNNRRNEAQ
jgi:hypothetical protein